MTSALYHLNRTQGKRLPDWLLDHLRNPPTKVRAGQNVAGWLWSVCKGLASFRSEGEALDIITEAAGHLRLKKQELVKTIHKAAGRAWHPDKSTHSGVVPPRKPAINSKLREDIISGSSIEVEDLWDLSPIILDMPLPATEWFLDRLFPKGCLLCCDERDVRLAVTKPREEWRGHLSECRGIVPSAMTALEGLKQDGSGMGSRTRSNTGDRRFLIIEQDAINKVPVPKSEQVKILFHLAEFAPLVMVVDSGGKSLHGWFYCLGMPEQKVAAFMRYAVSLGADDNFSRKEQPARMPDGLRRFDDGREPERQKVLFFNTEPLTAETTTNQTRQ
jgi:hypothetical protein